MNTCVHSNRITNVGLVAVMLVENTNTCQVELYINITIASYVLEYVLDNCARVSDNFQGSCVCTLARGSIFVWQRGLERRHVGWGGGDEEIVNVMTC